MKNPISRFLVRWFVCSLGLWIAAGLFGDSFVFDGSLIIFAVSGFILAVINTIIKPIVVTLSLPAILFSLGLFMIVINGLMVLLVSWLYKPLNIDNFGAAMLAGMVIGLVNYLVTKILEKK